MRIIDRANKDELRSAGFLITTDETSEEEDDMMSFAAAQRKKERREDYQGSGSIEKLNIRK